MTGVVSFVQDLLEHEFFYRFLERVHVRGTTARVTRRQADVSCAPILPNVRFGVESGHLIVQIIGSKSRQRGASKQGVRPAETVTRQSPPRVWFWG